MNDLFIMVRGIRGYGGDARSRGRSPRCVASSQGGSLCFARLSCRRGEKDTLRLSLLGGGCGLMRERTHGFEGRLRGRTYRARAEGRLKDTGRADDVITLVIWDSQELARGSTLYAEGKSRVHHAWNQSRRISWVCHYSEFFHCTQYVLHLTLWQKYHFILN